MPVTSPLVITVSSGLASFITTLMMNPFDVLKVRQQEKTKMDCDLHLDEKNGWDKYAERGKQSWNGICKSNKLFSIQNEIAKQPAIPLSFSQDPHNLHFSSLTPSPLNPNTLKSKIICTCVPYQFQSIIQKEGILTLWKGISHNLFQNSFSGILYMIVYQKSKEQQITNNQTLNATSSALFARAVTTTLFFPFEFLKIRLQGLNSNQMDKKIYMRVFNITMKRDLVFSSLFWTMFEKMKIFVGDEIDMNPNSQLLNKNQVVINSIISSSISGLIAGFLTTPIDVVKTRKQLNPELYGKMGVLRSWQKIIKEDGYKGLFKGYQPRCLRALLGSCIYITLYEYFMTLGHNLIL